MILPRASTHLNPALNSDRSTWQQQQQQPQISDERRNLDPQAIDRTRALIIHCTLLTIGAYVDARSLGVASTPTRWKLLSVMYVRPQRANTTTSRIQLFCLLFALAGCHNDVAKISHYCMSNYAYWMYRSTVCPDPILNKTFTCLESGPGRPGLPLRRWLGLYFKRVSSIIHYEHKETYWSKNDDRAGAWYIKQLPTNTKHLLDAWYVPSNVSLCSSSFFLMRIKNHPHNTRHKEVSILILYWVIKEKGPLKLKEVYSGISYLLTLKKQSLLSFKNKLELYILHSLE